MSLMSLAKKLLLMMGQGVGYSQYVPSLAPLLWQRYIETSGAAIANYGSLGVAANGTASNISLNQVGQLGAGNAASWNATTTSVVIANIPALVALPKQTWCFLHKPASLGENNAERLYNWGITAYLQMRIEGVNTVVSAVATDTVAAESKTANNFITFGAWQWTFSTYDDTGDRKVHVYKGVSGAVTEATYVTHIAATGILSTTPTDLYIGNRSDGVTTYDGFIDEVLLFNKVLSAAEMLNLVLLSGMP